jgi:hypothetical protein
MNDELEGIWKEGEVPTRHLTGMTEDARKLPG